MMTNGKITIKYVPVEDIRPNMWNPNVMTEDMYKKLVTSIRDEGFVVPVFVYRKKDKLVIIDGEHRWRAAQDLGMERVPVIEMAVNTRTAKQLSVVLNYMRGEADWDKYTDLVMSLYNAGMTEAELVAKLPLTMVDLEDMLATVRYGAEETEEELKRVYDEQKKAVDERKTFMLTFGPFSAKEKETIMKMLRDKEFAGMEEPLVVLRLMRIGYKRIMAGKDGG